jgi:small subunit ribosomal protein S8e
MAITQKRPKRKVSGGRYISYRKKRGFELGRIPTFTKLGEKSLRFLRTMGGHQKTIQLQQDTINLTDKEGKTSKVKIKAVLENPANRHFVRRNILTRGTIIDTEKGKAKITSRPGQEGSINATLI